MARGYFGGRAAAGRSRSAITMLGGEGNGNNDLGLADARLALAPSTGAMRFDRRPALTSPELTLQ